MAIAGVKPFKINYLEDDEFIENAWDEPNVQVHSGFPETFVGYTETQVREILVKFAELIDVEADVDFNWEEEPEVIGYDLVVENTIVRGREDMELAIDEFMKMGD